MSEELMPCPFCGGEARLDQRTTQSLWNSSDAVFSHVACDECDISGQDFCDDPNGEEASEWWNRRAQPAEAEGTGDWGGLRLAAKVAEEDGPWEPRIGMTNVETAFAQSASPTKVLELIAALSAVTAERDRLAEQASKFRLVERAMEALGCDEREGGIVTAASLILISSAHRMNAKRGVIDQEGVTLDDDCIGDWRVTIERISATLAAKESTHEE